MLVRITSNDLFVIYKSLYVYRKPSVVVVSAYGYHATGPEFDTGLGEVHPAFPPIGVDNMSAKLSWKLNIEGPALG